MIKFNEFINLLKINKINNMQAYYYADWKSQYIWANYTMNDLECLFSECESYYDVELGINEAIIRDNETQKVEMKLYY